MNLEAVSIPSTVNYINEVNPVFSQCTKLEVSVNKSEGKVYFYVHDHALYEPYLDDITLRWVPEKLTGTFRVQDGTTHIGRYAFYHTSIDKVIIPRSVKFIDTHFFFGAYSNGSWICKTPLEIELNWETAEEVNAITTTEDITLCWRWTHV